MNAKSQAGNKWDLLATMPNLVLEQPFETNDIAFVQPDDARLIGIRKNSPASRSLLENFTDYRGDKLSPSALIISADIPKHIKGGEAVVNLRNALSIASICYAWQQIVGDANVRWTMYSDYFDFFPLMPSNDGRGLIQTLGVSSWDDPKEFRGQPYPDLSLHIKAHPDPELLGLLVSAWRKRHIQQNRSWGSTALFRALAVAYRAARLPKGSNHGLYDIGVQFALWASALECLVHPGGSKSVYSSNILDHLGRYQWSKQRLRRKTFAKWHDRLTKRWFHPNGRQQLNYIQKLYCRLLDTRNTFMHGGPVRLTTLSIDRANASASLAYVAPLIFQTALDVMLSSTKSSGKSRKMFKAYEFSTSRHRLESALTKIKDRKHRYKN